MRGTGAGGDAVVCVHISAALAYPGTRSIFPSEFMATGFYRILLLNGVTGLF
jgi:hypothetical protein